MNVLSLFGGIECGRVAMERIGWNIDRYYSAEWDEYPTKVTKDNYPDIIHLGDVREVSYFPEAKVLQWGDKSTSVEFDIIIGGPPCQDLSAAKAGRKGLKGERSSYFYDFVRILSQVRPKYFLMENVASMSKEDKDVITAELQKVYGDTDVHMINSALVSGQKRKRLYWTNIPGIEQPEDKGILLVDILEDIPFDYEEANSPKKAGSSKWKKLDEKYITEKLKKTIYDKSYAMLATYQKAGPADCIEKHNRQIILGVYQRPRGKNEGGIVQGGEKAPTVNASRFQDNNYILGQFRRTNLRIHSEQGKSCTLTANMGTGGNNVPIILQDMEEEYYWRKLTPMECERLQTLPDNYTKCLSDSRRYKAIGNGWTVDVIKHILSHIK